MPSLLVQKCTHLTASVVTGSATGHAAWDQDPVSMMMVSCNTCGLCAIFVVDRCKDNTQVLCPALIRKCVPGFLFISETMQAGIYIATAILHLSPLGNGHLVTMCSLLGEFLSWSPSKRMLLWIKNSYLFHRVQRLEEINEKQ